MQFDRLNGLAPVCEGLRHTVLLKRRYPSVCTLRLNSDTVRALNPFGKKERYRQGKLVHRLSLFGFEIARGEGEAALPIECHVCKAVRFGTGSHREERLAAEVAARAANVYRLCLIQCGEPEPPTSTPHTHLAPQSICRPTYAVSGRILWTTVDDVANH